MTVHDLAILTDDQLEDLFRNKEIELQLIGAAIHLRTNQNVYKNRFKRYGTLQDLVEKLCRTYPLVRQKAKYLIQDHVNWS